MSRILNHRNWLTGDFDGLIKSVGSFYNLQSNSFYKFWLEHLDHKKKNILFNKIDNFLNSKNERLELKINDLITNI